MSSPETSEGKAYDSMGDTLKHIRYVQGYLRSFVDGLVVRLMNHDGSKLENPEKAMYDEFTPKLRGLTYGSDEYKACLQEMGPALRHHYAVNSHHPEHYNNGVGGMDLFDLVEMLSDWKAATLRHADGDILASLEINRTRFGLSDQLYQVLKNTVERMGWSAV